VNNEAVKLSIPQILQLAGYPHHWKYTGSYDEVWARVGNSIMPRQSYAIDSHMDATYFNPVVLKKKLV